MILNPRDVRFEAFRGRGPGGQHKNKHACCIRAIHEPTGLVATATSERSLAQNKRAALANLAAKLAKIAEGRLMAAKRARRDAQPEASFGSQIRTCRACGPDQGIKDHRSGAVVPISIGPRGLITADLGPLILAGLRMPGA